MVEENKIKDTDLPEPKQSHLSPEQTLAREWNLAVVFLSFVAVYAVIHKLIIPSCLSFTHLRLTPYSQIDWWFIHPVFLAFLLQKSSRNNSNISFLAGIAILYGIYEVYETSLGRNTGWLAFSRLLSSIPLAVGSGYLMCKTSFGGSLKTAWFGALALVSIITYKEYSLQKTSVETPAIPVVTRMERGIPKGEEMSCGTQELLLSPNKTSAIASQIKISACGLSPSSLHSEGGTLEIINERAEAVNLHLLSFQNGKPKTRWNLLVPAKSTIHTPPLTFSKEGVAMLYSNSSPGVGIIGLFSNALTHDWVLKRKPITFKVKP